jgi:hypothetical protein
MNIGDLVIIDNPKHSYHGKRGKIVGVRGNRTPVDPWFLVYVIMRGRSFLVPKSMMKIVEARTDKNEILIWPLSGEVIKKDSNYPGCRLLD